MITSLRSISLRFRLTLLTAALAIVVGILLVAFINVAAWFVIPQLPTVPLLPPQTPPSIGETGSPPDLSGPPAVTTIQSRPGPGADVLHRLQVISILGLIAAVALGSWGAYWVAGRGLAPVQRLSSAAQGITADTLTMRLDLGGPDDEIKELARSFNSMLDRLERSFQQQRRFVGDAAHELRTPLAVLRNNVEAVNADPNANTDDYREMSVILQRAVDRLDNLIEDLLILAREEGLPAPENVELNPLLEDVLFSLEGVADRHEVTLKLERCADLSVVGDDGLLERALANLAENAIRYNRAGGSVKLSVKQDDSWAIVTVADTGVGISPEAQSHIFERFFRVDQSRARNRGGAGLGLAITANIIERHGGSISVESTEGEGTKFTVRLPAASSVAAG